jgi:hypothetical protein
VYLEPDALDGDEPAGQYQPRPPVVAAHYKAHSERESGSVAASPSEAAAVGVAPALPGPCGEYRSVAKRRRIPDRGSRPRFATGGYRGRCRFIRRDDPKRA